MKSVAIGAICALSLAGGLGLSGGHINATNSVPQGFYWESSRQVSVGSYVLVCPPDNSIFNMARKRNYVATGFCPGRYGYMIKKVMALGGDIVSIKSTGVSVNNKRLPYSQPKKVDLGGRPLPQLRMVNYQLKTSDVLLMSDRSSTSFDARYFGLVDISAIQSVINPVIIW